MVQLLSQLPTFPLHHRVHSIQHSLCWELDMHIPFNRASAGSCAYEVHMIATRPPGDPMLINRGDRLQKSEKERHRQTTSGNTLFKAFNDLINVSNLINNICKMLIQIKNVPISLEFSTASTNLLSLNIWILLISVIN